MTILRQRKSLASFSLTEVVVAIGIVAFSMVAILGLASLSTQASKNATDQTNLALMTQTVISLLRTYTTGTASAYGNSPYVTMTALLPSTANSLTYYFDASGNPVHTSSGTLVSGTNGVAPSFTGASATPIYLCTVTNRTPAFATLGTGFTPPTNSIDIPQTPQTFNFALFRLDFAWPYNAANQQHQYAYTSLTPYY